MKIFLKYFFFLFVLVSSANDVHATRIKSGYIALSIKDYFKSQKKFTKALKYNPSPAAHGLASIYSRTDNPFYNKDTAYRYILLSDSLFQLTKERKRLKWEKYGWSKNGIDSLKLIISSQFFLDAKAEHTIASYSEFIVKHPWSLEYPQAVDTRDSLAFFQTVQANSAESYNLFLRLYPNSKYAELARDNFHNSQYLEFTQNDSLSSYLSFIEMHPQSPKRVDAEFRVFEIITAPNTVAAYEEFVTKYPDYSFNDEGWSQFYEVFLFDYSKARKLEFLDRFPNAKNRAFIVQDIEMTDSLFIPSLKSGKYGFSNLNGEVTIEEQFDFVGPFNEGLATVMMGEYQGAINKFGEIVIPVKYEFVGDFHQGRAVVELNELVGVIDRNHKEIIEPIHEDIGEASEGLIYVLQGEKYGYVDLNGIEMIAPRFDEAFDFKNNRAIVGLDGSLGIINRAGEFAVHAAYDELRKISDQLYVCSKEGKKGIVNPEGHVVIIPSYDQIGSFSEGLALATKSDTLLYLNELGEVVLEDGYKVFPNYLLKGEFNRGAAIVFKDGKYGRVNSKGDVLTEANYDNLGMGDGGVPFRKEGRWGMLSMSNKEAIEPIYQSLDVYDNDVVIVRMDDSTGVLDIKGNIIVPIAFNDIEWLVSGLMKVRRGGKYALFNYGAKLTDFDFDKIELFGDHFVSLLAYDKLLFYDLAGEVMIKRVRESE
ncbi:MAG: WG repeat-containing protein [Crocinitomicaceae bacterium]|nr:WG repeat-containing protein [Crocinitomicaceae bacterium]